MLLKKMKVIIAQLLIVTFIAPNINVKAIINTGTTLNQQEVNGENTENTFGENIIEPSQRNEDSLDRYEASKGKKYNKTKAINSQFKNYSKNQLEDIEREEFKLKMEALENLEVLEPMTENEYELTIANSDGTYEFVDGYDDLDVAINAAKALDSIVSETQEPAIINNFGRVIYSTNQMARIIKYSDNSPISGNIDIYPTPSMDKAFTYVNQAYIDDVPILEVSGNAVKVMINGYEGWINNNIESGSYDMIAVPLTTVTNPSYYTVKNGELVHFISYDLTGDTGYSKVLGKAPFFLKEGVRYLSYDGNYFYEYNHNDRNDIVKKLNLLMENYKNGIRTDAVNNVNPYHIYYLNLPFRSQTIYSADEIDRYIDNNTIANSKLRGLGQAFKDAETIYGVNALLALGVSINESAYGTSNIAQTKNNLFGLKAYDASPGESADVFETPRDSVNDFAKNYISRGYADPADWRYFGGFLGNKNRGANVKYASDPYWGEKAASFAYEVDKYLSIGSESLIDTNSKQIGIATANNRVVKKDGQLLYNITNDISQYGGYINTPFVVTNINQVDINGKMHYEIYPERNTPVGVGGIDNQYSGNYNWNDKGYIEASNVSFINEYLPLVETKYGVNRYSTAVELSKSHFESSETIVISNGYAIPDGITATPIASYYGGPLLLVNKDSIPQETQDEIKRLGAKNVIIVGGTGVITSNVEVQLKNLGIDKITRLGGVNRYETALQVAEYIDSNLYDVENVVIANGYGEADALSIAPISGRDRMPILLIENNNIPSEVDNWLRSEELNTAYIIGGNGVISDYIFNQINSITRQDISGNRLGGLNRYQTNAKIIERFYDKLVNKVYVTEGLELADALTAGPVASLNESPVIISGSELEISQRMVLDPKRTNTIVQVGGTVSKNVINDLRKLLSLKQ